MTDLREEKIQEYHQDTLPGSPTSKEPAYSTITDETTAPAAEPVPEAAPAPVANPDTKYENISTGF